MDTQTDLNQARRTRALAALDGYIDDGNNSLNEAVTDLLTDLRHLLTPEKLDQLDRRAALHYEAETRRQV